MAKGQFDSLLRLAEHVITHHDTTIMILKGHLFLEELINEILDDRLVEPIAIRGTRLTFFQKLRLLRALIGENALGGAFGLIEELNQLRNKLAHNLSPTDIDKSIWEFTEHASVLSASSKAGSFDEDVSVTDRLRFSMAIITGCLEGYIQEKTVLQMPTQTILGSSNQPE